MNLRDLFPGETGSILMWTFEVAMPTAEQVLRRYGDPPGLFRMLQPTPVLRGRPRRVLRAHYVELCCRFRDGRDLRPGTTAEVLCALSDASLVAPLNSTGAALAVRLAKTVIRFREVAGRGSYPGELRELLRECRMKTSQKWRKV